MPNRREHDHLTDHNWQLEIEGVTQGAFQSVGYQDGNDLILRFTSKWGPDTPMILKRGYINTTELWDWVAAVMDGKIERKRIDLVERDDSGAEVKRVTLVGALPKTIDAAERTRVQTLKLEVQSVEASP